MSYNANSHATNWPVYVRRGYERQLATDFPKRLPVPGGNEAWQTRQKEIDQISNALEELRVKTEKKARRVAKGSSFHQLTVGLLVVALIVLMRLGRHALLPMGVLLFLALASAVYGYRHPRGRTLGRWLVYEKRGGLAKMLQMEDELYRLSDAETFAKQMPVESVNENLSEVHTINIDSGKPVWEIVSVDEMRGFFEAVVDARRLGKDDSQHFEDLLTVGKYYQFTVPNQEDGEMATYYVGATPYLPLYIASAEGAMPFGKHVVSGQQVAQLLETLEVAGVQIRTTNQRVLLKREQVRDWWEVK